MDHKTCTLYSGGLKGAEATFGEAAEQLGVKEVIYTFEGHKLDRKHNAVILTKEELERGDISMELASRMLNRTYYETEKIRKVLQTIFHMVNNGHQVFVIGSILEDNSVKVAPAGRWNWQSFSIAPCMSSISPKNSGSPGAEPNGSKILPLSNMTLLSVPEPDI